MCCQMKVTIAFLSSLLPLDTTEYHTEKYSDVDRLQKARATNA